MKGNHIISLDIGRKIFTDLRIILVVFFLYSINLSISLPLNTAIYRIGNAPKILFPKNKEQNEPPPFPHFTFYCKIFKITLD